MSKYPVEYSTIIDANLNRASEGLRVIEEYCRFIAHQKVYTYQLAGIRKRIPLENDSLHDQLMSRNTEQDMRAKEAPDQRKNLESLLIANFKRVQQAMRVLEEYTNNAQFNQIRYELYELEKNIILSLDRKKLITPGIYVIHHDLSVLAYAVENGAAIVQYRAKNASKSEIYETAKVLKDMSTTTNVPVILNDHIDIVLALDLDGLHTGQDDIPVHEQRKLLGPKKWIGRTTHCLDQGILAQDQGADYVSVGPIWPTPSKPGRDGIGFDYLSKARRELNIPFVAIGGINAGNVDEIKEYEPPLIGVVRDYKAILEQV